MSVAPLQLLKSEFDPLVYVFLDNATDKLVVGAVYTGTTGTTPSDAYFSKGAILLHATDGTLYQNTAADGVTPTWVQLTNVVPGSNTITTAMLQAASVTLAKLATGIAPSHVVKYAGTKTTVGGSATETFTITGAATSDFAQVTLSDDGTNNVTIKSAKITASNTLTVVFSADPGNDATFTYSVLRAAA